jgi:hypothetical protein
MQPLLQNIIYLFNSTFIKKTHYPIISIILFIIVVILTSIQYANNNKYFQNKIVSDDEINDGIQKFNISYTLLYIFNTFGINAFIDNTPAYIFVFILIYFALALIELNIGHAQLLFLLFINLMFIHFWTPFTRSICENNYLIKPLILDFNCCSSHILFASLGFILCLLLKNIRNKYAFIFIICLMILICLGGVLYDYFKNKDKSISKSTSILSCTILTFHVGFFIFGIMSALAFGNY